MDRLNALYQDFGVDLGPLSPATTVAQWQRLRRRHHHRPARDARRSLGAPVPRSGRRSLRLRAGCGSGRGRGNERWSCSLIASDHADWDELTGTLAELRPGEVWITHGREEALTAGPG